MVIVRDIFQAKYGRGDELVQLFKDAYEQWGDTYGNRARILTDLSGQFFTVVTETEVESLAEWERSFSDAVAQDDFGKWFGKMTELVESGRREFFTVQASR